MTAHGLAHLIGSVRFEISDDVVLNVGGVLGDKAGRMVARDVRIPEFQLP
jgi:hypothetical protein